MSKFQLAKDADWCSPPGDTIKDFMEERGISIEMVGDALRLPVYGVEALLEGKIPLTPFHAVALETVLGGMTVDFWINLEAGYRLWFVYHNQVDETAPLMVTEDELYVLMEAVLSWDTSEYAGAGKCEAERQALREKLEDLWDRYFYKEDDAVSYGSCTGAS